MPHAPTSRGPRSSPARSFFGVGLEALHLVTVYWIAREVENKTETYGAIGFALALLLWAYLLGRLITSSAVVNETLWSRYQERRHAADAAAAHRPADRLTRLADESLGHAAGDPCRLRGEDRCAPSASTST